MPLRADLCNRAIDEAIWHEFRNSGPRSVSRVRGDHDYYWVTSALSLYEFLYDEISKEVPDFNNYYTRTPMRLTRYKPGHWLERHQDSRDPVRALTVMVQLTDPTTYQGGETMFDDGTIQSKEHGAVITSSPWDWHRVEPVTGGIRHSLIWWLWRPDWKETHGDGTPYRIIG